MKFFKSLKVFVKDKSVFVICLIGLLYFIGVLAIVYPIASNVLSLMTSKTVISSYEDLVNDMPPAEIKEKFEKAHNYNEGLSGETVLNKEYAYSLNGEDDIICYVDIPCVNIYLPVYYGTSDDVLSKGCGYLENTSLPVGGKSTHSVISGHTGLPTADMFTKLDEVKIGDLFYIHVLNEVLAYKVDKINTVTPNAIEELFLENGKDYVTLLTCTPYGINDKRLLVRGERVDLKEDVEIGETSSYVKRDTTTDNLSSEINNQILTIVIICVVAFLIFIVACIWTCFISKKVPEK